MGFLELLRLPHLGRKFDGRLERVVVSEDFRNKGLATKMCQHTIAQVTFYDFKPDFLLLRVAGKREIELRAH